MSQKQTGVERNGTDIDWYSILRFLQHENVAESWIKSFRMYAWAL